MSQEANTTTARRCIECLYLSIQDSFRYNKDTGLNVCHKKTEPVTLNWERPCSEFAPAPQQAIINRRKWRGDK
jgi:hypothetical protein